jgi:hypothetical protein
MRPTTGAALEQRRRTQKEAGAMAKNDELKISVVGTSELTAELGRDAVTEISSELRHLLADDRSCAGAMRGASTRTS